MIEFKSPEGRCDVQSVDILVNTVGVQREEKADEATEENFDYCAAKGGMGTLCKQLAAEWAPHKINVNMLAPTFVRTAQVARWLADPDFYRNLVARTPWGESPSRRMSPVRSCSSYPRRRISSLDRHCFWMAGSPRHNNRKGI